MFSRSLSSKVSFSTHASTPSFHTEVAVIGAGVVGLAITRALAESGKEVLLLDRATTICSETSSRNSEVIHAGIYYPPKSLKSKFCVEGKHSLYKYCEERAITYRNCGKLVVATNKSQLENALPALFEKAKSNGVNDVQLISQEDVKAMEPNVECVGALYSPSTGVVDSHSFCLLLLGDAESAGATLALNTTLKDIQIMDDQKLCVNADDTWISCDAIINSAGLWATEIANMIHKDQTKWQPPKQYFARGTYFRLEGKQPFSRLIYPVPEPGGLGVHATIDWGGNGIKFGPDVEWLDKDTGPDEIGYLPDPARGDKFYAEIRKYWPGIPDDSLSADYVGVRPKLSHPSTTTTKFDDFLILGHDTHKVPGLIHLFGIESPGLTSSMAIANYVQQMTR